MDFAEFALLDASNVARIVADRLAEPLGVGIPFNGTRRWYLTHCDPDPAALYTQNYLERVFGQMRAIIETMFADGVHTVYTPIMGYDLAMRGEDYMQFGLNAIGQIARPDVIAWYNGHQIDAACYGQLDLLPDRVRQAVTDMHAATGGAQATHFLRFGVFADRATDPLIALTCDLHERLGALPTAAQLLQTYYSGPVARLGMWIGSDQPTVFDVPLMLHGSTALYFLHYPTLNLDPRGWRRLLYDLLFVRGDQETLYPDNIISTQQVSGLGVRHDGGWSPSTF